MLAENTGCRLEPLPLHDAFEQCCGFGGQPGAANPEYADFVVQKRIAESENPYITYCVNCRDSFVQAGKEAVHILDVLFGDGKAPARLATVSERRENRIRLKRDLLKEYRNLKTEEKKELRPEAEKGPVRQVSISAELKAKLSRERILEEDVTGVVDFCERTGPRVYLPEKGTYSGYREIGRTTYWVEYRTAPSGADSGSLDSGNPKSGDCELVNAYAHRMKIELEPVWNGKKMEQDL